MKTLNNKLPLISALLMLVCIGDIAQATCKLEQFSREVQISLYSQCGSLPSQNIQGLFTATRNCNLKQLFYLMEQVCPSEHYIWINQKCTGQTAIPSCQTINGKDSGNYCIRALLKNYYAKIKFYCEYLSLPISSNPTPDNTQPNAFKSLPQNKEPTPTPTEKNDSPSGGTSSPLNIYY